MIPKDFKAHELWKQLEEIKETTKNLPAIKFDDEEDKRTIRDRLPLYISTLEQHKSNAADYYSNQLLEAMHQPWSEIYEIISNLENDPSCAYQIDQEIDKVAACLATWPTAFNLRGYAATKATETFEQVQNQWAQRIEGLEKQLEAKNQELADAEARHQELRKEIDADISELHAHLDENKRLIDEQNEKIAAQAVTHSELFEKSQQDRSAAHKKWFQQQETEIDEEVGLLLKELRETALAGDRHLEDIITLRDDVEKAVHGATAAVLARNYSTASLRDYVAGILFMVLGIMLLVVAGIFAVNSFADISPDTHISWQWTALKITGTLLLSAAATFSFKYSQNFLTSATQTKRTDLELRVVTPFLATLKDQDIADQTKVDFFKRSFGRQQDQVDDTDTSSNKDKESKVSGQEILNALTSLIKQNLN